MKPPYGLHWTINGARVHLSWEHSHYSPILGFYVSVQAVNEQNKLQAPDFVHVGKNVRSVNLQGLWPDAQYKVKVAAFSKTHFAESHLVAIETSGLELLRARNLKISGITTNSAIFQWEHDAKHTIHDTQLKLLCRGVRQYLDKGSKMIEEPDDFQYTLYASSQGKETYFANSLQSNTKYTCHITTVANAVESPPTPDVTFNTLYGIPLPPPQPKVTVHNNSSFTVHLYHSIEKFGPISHYKVFAVPVKKEADPQLPAAHHFVPIVPSSKLLTQAVLPQLLAKESDPAPFLVGTYTFKNLPMRIQFNGQEMNQILSFKPNTTYSFVIAAITKSELDGREGLHSFSTLANPSVFISKDLREDVIQLHQPVVKHFIIIIIICTLFIVFLLVATVLVGVFAWNRKKISTATNEDSREDEVYSKSANPLSSSQPTFPNESLTAPESAPLLALSPTPPSKEEESVHVDRPTGEALNQDQQNLMQAPASNSPARVPVTSIHNSPTPTANEPDTQDDIDNPLLNTRRISVTPITMQHVREYLVSKSRQPSVLSTGLPAKLDQSANQYSPDPLTTTFSPTTETSIQDGQRSSTKQTNQHKKVSQKPKKKGGSSSIRAPKSPAARSK